MSTINDDPYSKEPVGGGAESVPDPVSPAADRPDRSPADPGAEELGGADTVASNDELDGDVER